MGPPRVPELPHLCKMGCGATGTLCIIFTTACRGQLSQNKVLEEQQRLVGRKGLFSDRDGSTCSVSETRRQGSGLRGFQHHGFGFLGHKMNTDIKRISKPSTLSRFPTQCGHGAGEEKQARRALHRAAAAWQACPRGHRLGAGGRGALAPD